MLVDIHCHILPGIDDGAPDMKTARAMIQEAYKQGIRYMIATPHYRPEMFEPTMKRILRTYHALREYAADNGIGLRLGCECYRNEQILYLLDHRLRPTMLGTRYVLLEFSANDSFATVRNYVYELITHGYWPIIAHIERYLCCQELERVLELRDLGASIQVNADSVLGKDGHAIKKYCYQLMKNNLVDYIASDAHNMGNRKSHLGKCASYITKKMGQEYTEQIFVENPRKIWKRR